MSKTQDARTVPVPDAGMTVLVDHLKTYLPDAGREDFLFLTTRGTHPMRGNFGCDVLRRGLHPPDARTIQRRPQPTRDLHEQPTSIAWNNTNLEGSAIE
jgi:hypothetical protein